MKRVNLLVFICLVLAATAAACRPAPTPDPTEVQRLVAQAVRATIEAMPTATPYPTYTPGPPAPTCTPNPTYTVPIKPESLPGSTFRSHIVVAGDTLSAIAKEYGTAVEAIMAANEISDPGLIIVGQVLSIPIKEAGPISTPPTPTPLTPAATPMPPTATSTETSE